MDDGEDEGTNGGAAADQTGSGGGTGGAGGGNGAGGASGGDATGAGNLDRSKLNPLLRAMPEDQINEVFDALFSAVKNKANGPDLSGVPAHARKDEPPAPKKLSKDELKEFFDPNSEKFDPAAAMRLVVEENYSGLLNDIGANATVGLKAAIKAQLPDFHKYEADIDTVLKAVPSSQINQGFILDTYFKVKGLRQTQTELADAAKPPTTVRPSPKKDDVETGSDQLSDEDKQVAMVMFRGSADPIAEFKKASKMMDTQNMRVPGDPKPAKK